MINESKLHEQPHSAQYFGDYRDYWWNLDFIKLMGERLNFNNIKSVLDVGCGIGHWGQLLASALPQNTRVTGIDREDIWVEQSAKNAEKLNLSDRYSYQKADANDLPFPSEKFDMVTCQTVLIHVSEPKKTITEMLRVLKPGGLILLVEPNNMMGYLSFDNLYSVDSIEDKVNIIKFALLCQEGKKALGLGFISLGDLLPGYLNELDLANISVYISDKACPIYPPYSSKEQSVLVSQTKDWSEKEFWIWDKIDTKKYYLAGSGDPDSFGFFWDLAMKSSKEHIEDINNKNVHTAGGGMMYLVSGYKK